MRRTFGIWDDYASQIKYVLFFMLHDMSHEEAMRWAEVACSSGDSKACKEPDLAAATFETIGLRTWAGTGKDKLGFTAMIEEASDRNWPDH